MSFAINFKAKKHNTFAKFAKKVAIAKKKAKKRSFGSLMKCKRKQKSK